VQAALTWCSEEHVVNYAEILPNKLVVTMMKIFKKLQREESKKAPMARVFHVSIDED
jgi:hypothetical protein